MGDALELRMLDLTDFEARKTEDANAFGFVGHAAVFGQRTRIGGAWGWWEQVSPGAFRSALERRDDVRFLIDHDPGRVLATTESGDLRLQEDGVGLYVDADVDRRKSYAADFEISVERRHIKAMSFGFSIAAEQWEILPKGDPNAGDELRTLLDFNPLWDVSGVTYPAYKGTDASLRADDLERLIRSRGGQVGAEPSRATRAAAYSLLVAEHMEHRTRDIEMFTKRLRRSAARDSSPQPTGRDDKAQSTGQANAQPTERTRPSNYQLARMG